VHSSLVSLKKLSLKIEKTCHVNQIKIEFKKYVGIYFRYLYSTLSSTKLLKEVFCTFDLMCELALSRGKVQTVHCNVIYMPNIFNKYLKAFFFLIKENTIDIFV